MNEGLLLDLGVGQSVGNTRASAGGRARFCGPGSNPGPYGGEGGNSVDKEGILTPGGGSHQILSTLKADPRAPGTS